MASKTISCTFLECTRTGRLVFQRNENRWSFVAPLLQFPPQLRPGHAGIAKSATGHAVWSTRAAAGNSSPAENDLGELERRN
jgi:hypothetical protein